MDSDLLAAQDDDGKEEDDYKYDKEVEDDKYDEDDECDDYDEDDEYDGGWRMMLISMISMTRSTYDEDDDDAGPPARY